jgi:nucleotide-binding universal stress UspA family protein
MNYAWENGCDMVVMGVYSYTSRGGSNIGSVAKQLLEHMTLPVLFSH